jgi:gas vesicle protein
MNTGKVLVGVLAGVAAGAILGILFAPDKGTETRRKISKKGTDTLDEMKDKFDEMLSSLTEKFESVKDEANNFAANGKGKVEDLRKDAKNSMG